MGKAHFKFALQILVTVSIWCGGIVFFIVTNDSFDFARKIPVRQELHQTEDTLKNIIHDKEIDEKEAKLIVETEKDSDLGNIRNAEFIQILNKISEENEGISTLQEQRYIKSVEKHVENLRLIIYIKRFLSIASMILLTILMLLLFFKYRKWLKVSNQESEEVIEKIQ